MNDWIIDRFDFEQIYTVSNANSVKSIKGSEYCAIFLFDLIRPCQLFKIFVKLITHGVIHKQFWLPRGIYNQTHLTFCFSVESLNNHCSHFCAIFIFLFYQFKQKLLDGLYLLILNHLFCLFMICLHVCIFAHNGQ